MESTETDLAWAAGFVDGEGCISIDRRIRKGYVGHRLRVVASNTHQSALRRLQQLFGGLVYQARQKDGRHQAIWHWSIPGVAAGASLQKMLTYMDVKREQAIIGLAFVDTMIATGRRPVAPDIVAQRDRLRSELMQLHHGSVVR